MATSFQSNAFQADSFQIDAGGTTFNETLAESVAVAGIYDASVIFGNALNESVSPADTPAPAAFFVVSLSESVSLLDDYASTVTGGGTTYNETLAEAFAAVDSYNASVIFSNALAEVIVLAESQGATALYVSVVGETITLLAVQEGSMPGGEVWPTPDQVLSGVIYGPTGTEYTGTLTVGVGETTIGLRSFTGRF